TGGCPLHRRMAALRSKIGSRAVRELEQILKAAKGLRVTFVSPGGTLVEAGARSGKLYILKAGDLEVLRDGSSVAGIGEPGSVIGDMSVLLDQPHSATVRSRLGAEVYVVDQPDQFLEAHPAVARHL